MALTAAYFLEALTREVPETQPLVKEHLDYYDGLLLHLLTADLGRFAMQSFGAGQIDVLHRLLALIDVALREGVDEVQNAMAVSFVENSEWWEPTTQSFIEAWPVGLRAEVDRQRRASQ